MTHPVRVRSSTGWVDIAIVGPKGDPGPPGSGGDLSYIHTQNTGAAQWTIVHALGKYPSVMAVDTGGTVLLPDVTYLDANSLRVNFSAPVSGKAYLN